MYYDRIDAGLILANELMAYKAEPGVVLAVPRGGVPIAYYVAVQLGYVLDLLLTKKIGHPTNKEYAIGAVSLHDRYVVHHEGVSQEYINQETEKIREKLKEMYVKFMDDKLPADIHGKTVIIVDDGIATGNTLLSTIRMLKKSNPSKIIIAVPVASKHAIEKLRGMVDKIICPLVPDTFYGVGAFYKNFDQVSDEEVMMYLNRFNNLRSVAKPT
jgi:putative phosphoribosyl transferase